MALGADRYASRADTLAFLGCVLLSVAEMSLPERVRDPLARGLRQTVLAPFLTLQEKTELLSASLQRYESVVAQRDSGGRERVRHRRAARHRGTPGVAAGAAGRGLSATGPQWDPDPDVRARWRAPAGHPHRYRRGRGGRSRGVGADLPHPPRRAPG